MYWVSKKAIPLHLFSEKKRNSNIMQHGVPHPVTSEGDLI